MAAPLSPLVGQSDFARLGRLTILLPHFDLRLTLVLGIEVEPPPSLQWWRRLSAVERMLTRWSSVRGESNLRTQTNVRSPKLRTFQSKVTRGCTRPLLPTQGGEVWRAEGCGGLAVALRTWTVVLLKAKGVGRARMSRWRIVPNELSLPPPRLPLSLPLRSPVVLLLLREEVRCHLHSSGNSSCSNHCKAY